MKLLARKSGDSKGGGRMVKDGKEVRVVTRTGSEHLALYVKFDYIVFQLFNNPSFFFSTVSSLKLRIITHLFFSVCEREMGKEKRGEGERKLYAMGMGTMMVICQTNDKNAGPAS